MGNRIAYFGSVKLGTHLLAIDPLHERGNRNVIAGIRQARVHLETQSPNFAYTYRLRTQEYETDPASRSEAQLHQDVLEEFKTLENLSDDNTLRPLVWIEDDDKTTTVSNPETAGSNVDVEIASLAALGAVAGDYVLILGSSSAWVYLVDSTGSSPDKLVLDLTEGLAGGETVYLVRFYYPDCRYDGQDPGRKAERSLARVAFSKGYIFTSGSQPLWRTS